MENGVVHFGKLHQVTQPYQLISYWYFTLQQLNHTASRLLDASMVLMSPTVSALCIWDIASPQRWLSDIEDLLHAQGSMFSVIIMLKRAFAPTRDNRQTKQNCMMS